MFIEALVTIAKTWKQPKCPSMIDWTGRMWLIYTMEYYAAIKNNEFVSFAGTWMNLETIILRKLTQEQRIKHCMFLAGVEPWEHIDTRREASHTEVCHWGRLGEGEWGRVLGRNNMGRNARYRWPVDGGSKPHFNVCTCATILHDLHMYPRTLSTIKKKKEMQISQASL